MNLIGYTDRPSVTLEFTLLKHENLFAPPSNQIHTPPTQMLGSIYQKEIGFIQSLFVAGNGS